MTRVVITPTARDDLETLIRSHSLPADTVARFKRSVASLETFPHIGAPLDGRWTRYRFILGPWRWMLVVYLYDETLDRVAIATIQDARSSRAATAIAAPGPSGSPT
jgi:plasmid stabilization system protein ParE